MSNFFGTPIKSGGGSRLSLRPIAEVVHGVMRRRSSKHLWIAEKTTVVETLPEANEIHRILLMYGLSSRLMRINPPVPPRVVRAKPAADDPYASEIRGAQRLSFACMQHSTREQVSNPTGIAGKVARATRVDVPVIRRYTGFIGSTPLCRPEEISSQLRDFKRSVSQLPPGPATALVCSLWLLLLHPFDDCNGRTARVLGERIAQCSVRDAPFSLVFLMQEGQFLFTNLLQRIAVGEPTDAQFMDYLDSRLNIWFKSREKIQSLLCAFSLPKEVEKRPRRLPSIISTKYFLQVTKQFSVEERRIAEAMYESKTLEINQVAKEVMYRKDLQPTLDTLANVIFT